MVGLGGGRVTRRRVVHIFLGGAVVGFVGVLAVGLAEQPEGDEYDEYDHEREDDDDNDSGARPRR